MSKVKQQKQPSPQAAPATMAQRAAGYAKGRAKTAVANIGFYLMLVLDVVFLTLILLAGYNTAVLVWVCIFLALEVVAVLFLLPMPLLQVGIVKKNALYTILFLLMPVLELGWGITLRYGTSGVVYIIFAAARVLTWITAFFLSRLGMRGWTGILLGTLMAAFVLFGAGALFEFPLDSRPMMYTMRVQADGSPEGYVVEEIIHGTRDNVRIPAVYQGLPVIGVEVKNNVNGMRNLFLPESVQFVSLQSSSLQNLTVEGSGVWFYNLECDNLKTLAFAAEDGLPQNMPQFREDNTPTIFFHRDVIDKALQETSYESIRDSFAPLVSAANNEGYILYHTDYYKDNEKEAARIDFFVPTDITQGSGTVTLPTPDLKNQGYEFIGWYTSRDYQSPVTAVGGIGGTHLYAKYLRLYEAELYKDVKDKTPVAKFTYHCESNDILLPTVEYGTEYNTTLQKDGYAFCGWYEYTQNADGSIGKAVKEPRQDEDIKRIARGSSGNKIFVPEYKKLYTVTVHAQAGDTYAPVVSSFHEWSDFSGLGDAQRDGYTFMGWYLDTTYQKDARVYNIPDVKDGELLLENYDLYPKFNLNYTIAFETNNGSQPTGMPAYYHVESPEIKLTNSVRTGYIFAGWWDNEQFAGSAVTSIFTGSTGTKTFYAKWTPITYNVTYSPNGGDGKMVTSIFTYDATETLSQNLFVRTGYAFAGWTRNGGSTVYEDNKSDVFNFTTQQGGTVTLVAQWSPITYTVKYNGGAGGNTVTGSTADSQFTYDRSGMLAQNGFTRTGYAFAGWQINGETYAENTHGYFNFASVQDAEVTATAMWKANTYKIRYSYGVNLYFDENATFDQDVVIARCTATKDGYKFVGWKIGENIYNPDNVENFTEVRPNFTSAANGIVTATAMWQPIKYKLHYIVDGDQGKQEATFVKEFGDSSYEMWTLPDEAKYKKTGYLFDYWLISGDGWVNKVQAQAGSSGVDFSHTENEVLDAVAVWRAVTYSVLYARGGDGATGDTASTLFTYDATDNKLAQNGFTRTGYNFSGWEYNGKTYNAGELISENWASEQNATVTVTAQWTPVTYTVKYNPNVGDEGGAQYINDSTFTYNGDNNYLSSMTRTGYILNGWRFDGTLYPVGKTQVNFASEQGAEVVVSAQWTRITYKVQYQGDGVDLEESVFYYDLTNTFHNPQPRTGYTFAGWKVGETTYIETTLSKGTNLASTQDAVVTAIAVWEAHTYTLVYTGVGVAAAEQQTMTYGEESTLHAAPVRTGYLFLGWEIDGTLYEAGETGVFNFTADKVDVVATAQWDPVTYTVQYVGGEGATGEMEADTFTYGKSKTLPFCTFVKEGYNFVGWEINGQVYGNVATGVDFADTQDATVIATAVWEKREETTAE